MHQQAKQNFLSIEEKLNRLEKPTVDAAKDKADELQANQAQANKKVSLATLKRRQQQQLKQENHQGRSTAQTRQSKLIARKEEDHGDVFKSMHDAEDPQNQ